MKEKIISLRVVLSSSTYPISSIKLGKEKLAAALLTLGDPIIPSVVLNLVGGSWVNGLLVGGVNLPRDAKHPAIGAALTNMFFSGSNFLVPMAEAFEFTTACRDLAVQLSLFFKRDPLYGTASSWPFSPR